MALLAGGFGFIPVYHPSGLDRPTEITPVIVGSRQSVTGQTSNLFKHAPVYISATGLPEAATSGGRGAGDTGIVGTFLGIEYTDAVSGRRLVSPYIAGGLTLVDPVYWLHTDPNIVFETQAQNGTGAATSATAAIVGDVFGIGANPGGQAIVAGAGTGLSTAYLDLTNATAPSTYFRVIDHGWEAFSQAQWYDATYNPFPTVRVTVARHQFADRIGNPS
jgi:hypothetical protein